MKTTPNPTFDIKDEAGKPLDAAGLLKVCLAQPPQQGFDFAEMRARNRIADALDKLQPGDEIKLEDADHAKAVECVKARRWLVNHPDLLKFAELFGA